MFDEGESLMGIEELRKRKRKLELDLREAIKEKLDEFNAEAGLQPHSISVLIVPSHSVAALFPDHHLVGVEVDLGSI